MREPCVLLISPGIIRWTDVDFGLPHLVALGSYLKAHAGVRVEILDLGYEGSGPEGLAERLEELGPYLLVGVACYSSFDYMRVMSLGRFLADTLPGTPLVAGGYHASALPFDLVFDGSPYDAAIVGEGEVPLLSIVKELLGGKPIERGVHGPANVEDLDSLPPYDWGLLERYWSRAYELGRKFQIFFSRGCPYRCTFCMERAKTEYKWRAFSPERTLEELWRLSSYTKLSKWVVNIADPLFGFRRKWRRQVLEGIIREELYPRQYWTLTRSDDLDEQDVELLAKARFSIGIGAESGSPAMLREMQKAQNPSRYLAALERLARLSRRHGLNWATNVIVGHPGETPETMEETHAFFRRLFLSAPETCGWLSIDPFRLYPGALVHEQAEDYGRRFGTRFWAPDWWKSWYDGPFLAELVDPRDDFTYEARVRKTHDLYAPLIAESHQRFRGQGRSIDRVLRSSLAEQAELMSAKTMRILLDKADTARRRLESTKPRLRVVGNPSHPGLRMTFPLGLQVRDEATRRRENEVRRLLEDGTLRTEALAEAFLSTPTEPYRPQLSLRLYALMLEALALTTGECVVDLRANDGYFAALASKLVGERGRVVVGGRSRLHAVRLRRQVERPAIVRAGSFDAVLPEDADACFLGAALPELPSRVIERLHPTVGRAALFVGPRFRSQDLLLVSRRDGHSVERRLGRALVPLHRGEMGWFAA